MSQQEKEIPIYSAVVKLEEFTPELLGDIASIYRQTVGGHPEDIIPKGSEVDAHKHILESWEKYGPDSVEHRFGSRINRGARLWLIKQPTEDRENFQVEVSFDANLSSNHSADLKRQVRELKANFAQRVQERVDRKEEQPQ